MDARSRRARGGCIVLVLATVYLAGPALARPAFAQASAPIPAAPLDLEDRQGWSADKKADEATKRAADLRAQAHRRTSEPCPAVADWHRWFQDTLDLEGSWVAMREVRDKVRVSGAGSEKVGPFREAFGSSDEWESLVNALRRNMIDCARQLNVRRADSSEEVRMVAEREQQRRAIELGELGFGPRVPVACPNGECRPGRGTPRPSG